MAAKMRVPNLPRFDGLPPIGEVFERYEIRPPRLHRLTAELAVAGLALSALLSLIGASASRIALLAATLADKGRRSKRAFGPYAGTAIRIETIASVTA